VTRRQGYHTRTARRRTPIRPNTRSILKLSPYVFLCLACAAGASGFLAGRVTFKVSGPVTLLVLVVFVGFSIIVASAESKANGKDE